MRPLDTSPEPVRRGGPAAPGRYDLAPRFGAAWWMAAVCLLVVLLAACGGDDGPDEAVPSAGGEDAAGDEESAASEQEQEQELLDWVACMREQGIDVPDPEVDADGNMRMPGIQVTGDGSGPSPEEAQEVCGDIPPPPGGGGGQRADSSELEDAALEYAQCMRDHGIDMPDPEVDGGRVLMGGGPGGGGGSGGGGNIQDDPAFQEAQDACQDIMESFGGGAGSSGAG